MSSQIDIYQIYGLLWFLLLVAIPCMDAAIVKFERKGRVGIFALTLLFPLVIAAIIEIVQKGRANAQPGQTPMDTLIFWSTLFWSGSTLFCCLVGKPCDACRSLNYQKATRCQKCQSDLPIKERATQ